MGTAILHGLVNIPRENRAEFPFARFVACVRSQVSEEKLRQRFSEHADRLAVSRGDNVNAVANADAVIVAVDPADIKPVLAQPGVREALGNKLLISVAAGWTRQQLETALYGETRPAAGDNAQNRRAWVVCTLPNIAAQVSQSITAIELSEPALPESYLNATTAIFDQIGRTVCLKPGLMPVATAVGGSTPAFFAVICDAFIDAAVAVGLPRETAHTMIFQAMQGTATMLQSGVHPALLKDQGTSPEGCTIGGLMVMEENGVRGHVGRALREAVTLARLMGKTGHVNDTRH